MKKVFFFLLVVLFCEAAPAQNKQSSIWFIGGQPRTTVSTKSIATLDFSGDKLDISRREDIKGISFDLNSTSNANQGLKNPNRDSSGYFTKDMDDKPII